MTEKFRPSSDENLMQFVPRHQSKKMATYGLKQKVVLLYQDLELRAKRSLSRLVSRDFVMSGKFSPLPAK